MIDQGEDGPSLERSLAWTECMLQSARIRARAINEFLEMRHWVNTVGCLVESK